MIKIWSAYKLSKLTFEICCTSFINQILSRSIKDFLTNKDLRLVIKQTLMNKLFHVNIKHYKMLAFLKIVTRSSVLDIFWGLAYASVIEFNLQNFSFITIAKFLRVQICIYVGQINCLVFSFLFVCVCLYYGHM